MPNSSTLPLAECSEFNQALRSRPSRLVHATVVLLLLTLGAALSWAELTEANLVVRGSGQIRPLRPTQKVFHSGRTEVLSASTGGLVVSVHYAEGQTVRAGDVLIRLDTSRVDNEIEQRKKAIATAEGELRQLELLRELAAAQDRAARTKCQAELTRAERETKETEDRRRLELQRAEIEHKSAAEELTRCEKALKSGAGSLNDVGTARARLAEAVEKLQKASLPVDTSQVSVCRESLVLVEREGAIRLAELNLKQETKRGELAAARLALSALELERRAAELVAPVGGIVTTTPVKVGDLLLSGKPVVEIADQDGFRFETALPTAEVGELRPGMPAQIKLDAYDYQRYGTLAGTVESISPDAIIPEGQQAPVYLVRIKIEADEVCRGERVGKIKLGMAGQVEIVTGQEPLLHILAKKIRRTISLG
jgi:adhesin transport system membrane fusion protein